MSSRLWMKTFIAASGEWNRVPRSLDFTCGNTSRLAALLEEKTLMSSSWTFGSNSKIFRQTLINVPLSIDHALCLKQHCHTWSLKPTSQRCAPSWISEKKHSEWLPILLSRDQSNKSKCSLEGTSHTKLEVPPTQHLLAPSYCGIFLLVCQFVWRPSGTDLVLKLLSQDGCAGSVLPWHPLQRFAHRWWTPERSSSSKLRRLQQK